jgi:DNA invertase Pin-like site-specific DNA recombinase
MRSSGGREPAFPNAHAAVTERRTAQEDRMDEKAKKRPRAGVYARVSSGSATSGQTTANQIPILFGLCEQRGYEPVLYNEVASAVSKRPVLERLMDDARKGKIDVVVVFAIDRLGRSLQGNLDLILELDRLGVQVRSYTESWLSMDSPVRSLLICVFSWISMQERLRIGERCRAGLDRARARGVKLGRPPVQVDTAKLVALHEQGLSVRKIGKALGIGGSTVCRLLAAHRTLATASADCAGIPGAKEAA